MKKQNGAQCECTFCQKNHQKMQYFCNNKSLHSLSLILIQNCFYYAQMSILIRNFVCKFVRFFLQSTENKLDEINTAKKNPYLEYFWSVFSRIRTEYVEILRIQENMEQKSPTTNTSRSNGFCRKIAIPSFGN